MSIEGGCYCGEVRYRCEAGPTRSGQCHCRECQYITGGNANLVVIFDNDAFSFTKGQPKEFTRQDLSNPVSRFFCEECGTHLCTRSPNAPGSWIVKVGSLDDPSLFEKPDVVIWTSEKQAFHYIPEGVPTFSGFPK